MKCHKRNWLRLAASMVFGLSLQACSANHFAIHHFDQIKSTEPSLAFVDAKQRAVIGNLRADKDYVLCSEPSPDVFSVLAQSASASGSLGQSANPKSLQIAANAAYASAEQGSTISRTQTVNMLRESMYRTCERYMNGAIAPLEMSLQAVRDQRLMISILAIEQLTAAAAPQTLVIGAAGSAQAGATAQDAVVRVDDANKTLAKAQADQTDKQTAYDALQGASPSCTDIDAQAAAKTPALTPDEVTKQGDCASAQSALTTAKAATQKASEDYDALKKIAGSAGPAAAIATVADPKGVGGGAASPAALQGVVDAVGTIVKENYDQDELQLLCLKVLSPDAKLKDTGNKVLDACIQYIQADLDAKKAAKVADAAKSNADAAKYNLDYKVASDAIAKYGMTKFSIFWSKIVGSDPNKADPIKLAAVIDEYLQNHPKLARPDKLKALKSQMSRDAIYSAFSHLPSEYQTELAK